MQPQERYMFVDFQVVIFLNGCEILTQLFFLSVHPIV